MNQRKNSKLCWHCEGEVDKDAIYCLYCGSDLGQAQAKAEVPEPAYRPAKVVEEAASVQEAPFSAPGFVLLLTGALFFVFALFLLFFSEDGFLTLKWDASYWFVYLLLAIPILAFGLKLSKPHS